MRDPGPLRLQGRPKRIGIRPDAYSLMRGRVPIAVRQRAEVRFRQHRSELYSWQLATQRHPAIDVWRTLRCHSQWRHCQYRQHYGAGEPGQQQYGGSESEPNFMAQSAGIRGAGELYIRHFGPELAARTLFPQLGYVAVPKIPD